MASDWLTALSQSEAMTQILVNKPLFKHDFMLVTEILGYAGCKDDYLQPIVEAQLKWLYIS